MTAEIVRSELEKLKTQAQAAGLDGMGFFTVFHPDNFPDGLQPMPQIECGALTAEEQTYCLNKSVETLSLMASVQHTGVPRIELIELCERQEAFTAGWKDENANTYFFIFVPTRKRLEEYQKLVNERLFAFKAQLFA